MDTQKEIGAHFSVNDGKLIMFFHEDVNWIRFSKLQARLVMEIIDNYNNGNTEETDVNHSIKTNDNVVILSHRIDNTDGGLYFEFSQKSSWIRMDKNSSHKIRDILNNFVNSKIRHLRVVR